MSSVTLESSSIPVALHRYYKLVLLILRLINFKKIVIMFCFLVQSHMFPVHKESSPHSTLLCHIVKR